MDMMHDDFSGGSPGFPITVSVPAKGPVTREACRATHSKSRRTARKLGCAVHVSFPGDVGLIAGLPGNVEWSRSGMGAWRRAAVAALAGLEGRPSSALGRRWRAGRARMVRKEGIARGTWPRLPQ